MPLEVFPTIICAYSRLFELALGEMERRFVQGRERGLDLAHSEAVALLDRLGGYCFTGHDRHLAKTVLRLLGTVDSIRSGAWPYVDPAVLDFGANAGGAVIHMGKWPRSSKTARPVLLHVSELQYHYGIRISSNRESGLWFAQLGEAAFKSKSAVADFVAELLRELWVPQSRSFKRRLHEGGETDGRPITSEDIRTCDAAIEAWEGSDSAFTWKAFEHLARGLAPGGSRVVILASSHRARHDFASELLRVIGSDKGRDAFSSKNATRPLKLHLAILNGRKARDGIHPTEWVGVLTSCLLAADIEWAPDSIRGRLTSRNIVRLQGKAGAEHRLVGPPGSLRRAAQEAAIKHENAVQQRALRAKGARIDFGCPFPFKKVPELISSGFEDVKKVFLEQGGDLQVLDHYQLAMNCLGGNIDDSACHVVLMITLTLSSSSTTPWVAPKSRTFSVSPKRKDRGHFALAMVTRMMWFLYPTFFPRKKGSGGTAYDVAEMTQKLEHKGCNNRMLRELGWVSTSSKRDNPRNTEVVMRPREQLLAVRDDLVSAFKRPEDFIAIVFRSSDELWVERCESIIKRY